MRWIFYLLIVVATGFPAFAIEEVIPLSVGLDDDFPLDPSFEGKKIYFTGTYKLVTSISYNKANNTIRFSPIKKGVGTLHIKQGKKILKKYTVDVRKTDLNKVAHEIRSLLSEIDGISIKIINNKVIVDGEILVPRDMKRIFNVVKEYPKKATSLVRLSTSAQNKVAQFIQEEIGDPGITVKAANEKFILEGIVSSQEKKDNAGIIAQLYAPSLITESAVQAGVVRDRNVKNVVINLIQVQPQKKKEQKQNKLIQLVVHYVELDKAYENQFRFQWAPGIADGSQFQFSSNSASSIGAILSGTINNFLPKLNWAKNFGFARILHSSSIIVEEGEQGVVKSVQSIPYTTLSGNGGAPSTQTKDAGIELTITPYVVGERKGGVRLVISFSVSSLLGIVDGGPIISGKAISTKILVRSGKSAAIGGIISNTSRTGYNREPSSNQSRDPIFNLLSSKAFGRNQSQFVVFVTPNIKSSASRGVEKVKAKFRIN